MIHKEPRLNAESIKRIRESFSLLEPKAGALMDEFYRRLFDGYPSVRPLFPADMTAQKKHLLAAVALVVKNADRLDSLEKPLMDMGARHVAYGAKPEHYPIVRDVMLDSLAVVAGPVWNETLRADWHAALSAVATVMIRGAEQATKQAA